MSNQTNGLRFDVYERVHLPDDVAAIDELEEIELVPRIQVIDQGDQAILKGQLLLSGVYRSEHTDSEPLTLEHWIPVEISLPMNRVARLDDISIEIDNFDVDLLSSRTLNVTGVLSLRGIVAEQVAEEATQHWQDEPFTAVHQREWQEPVEQASLDSDARMDTDEVDEQDQPEVFDPQATIEFNRQELEQAYYVQEQQREQQEQQETTIEQSVETDQSDAIEELLSEEQPDAQFADTISNDTSRDDQPTQGVQIAFAGKESEPAEEPQTNFGFRNLLQSSKREQASREATEQVVAEQQQQQQQQLNADREQAIEDEVEWKKLFLSQQGDDQEFRKIRMCIVQKEETLEQIALRYSLNPRELLIHNGLHESSVEEGQLLYIP